MSVFMEAGRPPYCGRPKPLKIQLVSLPLLSPWMMTGPIDHAREFFASTSVKVLDAKTQPAVTNESHGWPNKFLLNCAGDFVTKRVFQFDDDELGPRACMMVALPLSGSLAMVRAKVLFLKFCHASLSHHRAEFL